MHTSRMVEVSLRGRRGGAPCPAEKNFASPSSPSLSLLPCPRRLSREGSVEPRRSTRRRSRRSGHRSRRPAIAPASKMAETGRALCAARRESRSKQSGAVRCASRAADGFSKVRRTRPAEGPPTGVHVATPTLHPGRPVGSESIPHCATRVGPSSLNPEKAHPASMPARTFRRFCAGTTTNATTETPVRRIGVIRPRDATISRSPDACPEAEGEEMAARPARETENRPGAGRASNKPSSPGSTSIAAPGAFPRWVPATPWTEQPRITPTTCEIEIISHTSEQTARSSGTAPAMPATRPDADHEPGWAKSSPRRIRRRMRPSRSG